MAKVEEAFEIIKGMTILELRDLNKKIEDEFGIKAAAPVAVARAAGCHASRVDGSPLAYNQINPKMPDILVCRPALAGALLQAIREVTNAP